MHNRNRLVGALGIILPMLVAVSCSEPLTAPGAARPALSTSVDEGGIPTGRTVIVFTDTASIPESGLALISALGGTVTTRWDDIGVAFAVGVTTDALAALEASDLIAAVGNDRVVNWLSGLTIGSAVEGDVPGPEAGDPSKSSYYVAGTQWGPRVIKADAAWTRGFEGLPTTRVAILDTGIDYTHRELRGLVDMVASRSFTYVAEVEGVEVEPQYPGDEPFMDNHMHGSHVAATVASNNISVSGVAPDVTLIAVKVLNLRGSGSFEGVASGIRYASTEGNADVINMSLGAMVEPSEEGVPALLELMKRVIRAAEKEGAIVISAAGNDTVNLDTGTVVSTPCEQSTLCVSATGPFQQQDFDQLAVYSNFGMTAIEVAAPGGNARPGYVNADLIIGVCSSRASSATLNVCRVNAAGGPHFYAYAAGTSMAAPHASGLAALLKSYYPMLGPKAAAKAIMHSADDVQEPGRDAGSNWGRINVARALNLE